jgi:DNA polymerase III subunit delta'
MARAPAVLDTEAPPEADRLDGYPHPRETKALYGHDAAEAAFIGDFGKGRPHHGWLITGREGIGKATLAYRIARYVLADPSERDPFGQSLAIGDDAIAARQVLALSHPGLLVIRRPYDHKTKKHTSVIPVDEVRRLRSFLAHTAGEGAWRAIIVDSADELNISSANALLKSLEEPPPRAIFLLTSSEPGRLLPTIRSRCRTLDLHPLGTEDLRRAVVQAVSASESDAPGPQDWAKLVTIAGGSVRRALMLSGAGGLKLYERVRGIAAALPEVDWVAAHQLGDELSGTANTPQFHQFFDLLLDLVWRLVRAGVTGDAREEDAALAHRLMSSPRQPAFAEAWQAIIDDKADTLALNLDRKALILSSLARLEAAARA